MSHLVTDRAGRVLRFVLMPGQRGDAPQARRLLAGLPTAAVRLADAAYDSVLLRSY